MCSASTMNAKERCNGGGGFSIGMSLFQAIVFSCHSLHKGTVFFRCIIVGACGAPNPAGNEQGRMPPFLVMPGSLRERYFCLSLIEPCNIVKIVVVFSDGKATSITHTHSDARFAFKSFDVNGRFNIGIRFVAKYSLVFQIQLIKVQQILLGASITVCKKKIKIIKIYSTFSTIPSESGFLFGRIMLKV